MKVDLNTTLSLPGGLIHLPVSLSTARSSSGVKFDRRGPNGKAIKRLEIEDGDESKTAVTADGIKRGILAGDTFHEIDAAKLAEIEERHKLEGLTLEGFMPLKEIAEEEITGAYFVYPQRAFPAAAKGLRLLYEGLKARKAAAPTKLVMRSRQQRAAVIAHPSGALMVLTFVFAANARQPEADVLAPQEVKVTAAEKKQVVALVDAFMGDGEEFRAMSDSLDDERQELVDRIIAGEKLPDVTEVHEKNVNAVQDIMAALQESMTKGKVKA